MTDHFKDFAKKYDNDWSKAISRGVASQIVNRGTFSADSTSALELGCGTGLLTTQMAPHLAKLLAVDVSPAMLDFFAEKQRRGDIPSDKVTVKELDLLDPEAQLSLEGQFDVVFSALAYHHIPDHKGITAALFKVLKPGGKLYIVDLLAGGRSLHGNMSDKDAEEHGVSSRGGFSVSTMNSWFISAGFVDFESHEFEIEGWASEWHSKDHQGKTGREREVDGEKEYETITDMLLSIARKP